MASDEKTDLAAGGLGEPECPLMHERVLDVEVVGVVEDGHELIGGRSNDGSSVLVGHGVAILCDGGHDGVGG